MCGVAPGSVGIAGAAGNTSTWTGLGADNFWTTAANWDVVPTAGDDLVFPDIPDEARHTAVNDFAAGTGFGSIRIGEPGYTLSGNALSETGGLTADYGTGTSTITIATTLGAGGAVSVQDGGTLTLSGVLSGTNGISKLGAGLVLLTRPNNYSGVTTINAGRLAIANSSALGSSAGGNGTTVVSGATLEIRGTINTSEPISIIGVGASGVGSLFNGTGNNVVQSVTLTGDSTIGTATGTFLLIPSALTQSGGAWALTTSGGGVLDVLATAGYTGGTTVASGNLAVEGTVSGPILVQAGATVSGAGGNLGDVTSTGGALNAGFATSPFTSDANSVVLDAASTFVVRASGTTPGNGSSGYSQLNVAAGANLGSASLSLSIGGGYSPAPGDSLAILRTNGGVTGTFNGLPEGSHLSLGAGRDFRITYQADSGTDVVLTAVDATTTGLSSSANPSAPGQSVTFTATVASVRVGGPVPTGTVSFNDGAVLLGTGVLVDGVATLSTAALTTGSHTLTAVFAGDAATAPSTSAPLSQVVAVPGSTTALSSSDNPSTFAQPVTFTATVAPIAPATGTPAGDVSFFDGATLLGTTILVNGVATLQISTLAAGSHTISAVYGGEAAFTGSTSAPLTQVVDPASSTTSLTVLPEPSIVGQPVALSVVVSSPAGVPTGTVEFFDGASSLGSASLSGGSGGISVSTLAVGSHALTASYTGDGSFNGSVSSVSEHVVDKAASTVALSSSADPAAVGAAVTFTAAVAAPDGAGSPTGSVVFTVGGVARAPVAVDGTGTAIVVVSDLPLGETVVSASYSGDAFVAASSSNALQQTVVTGQGGVALVAASASSAYGDPVSFTATVTSSGPLAPTGDVELFDGAASLGTQPLSAGTATFTASGLGAGDHVLTARYAGDANTSAVTSSNVTLAVVRSSTSVDAGANVAPSGAVSVSVTVGRLQNAQAGAAPSAATVTVAQAAQVGATPAAPTGTVTLTEGSTVLSTGSLAGGALQLAGGQLSPGTHVLSVTYSGDADHSGATATTTVTVAAAVPPGVAVPPDARLPFTGSTTVPLLQLALLLIGLGGVITVACRTSLRKV